MRIRIRIRIQHFLVVRIRIRIQSQGFDDKKLGKHLRLKKSYIFLSKIAIYYLIPTPPYRGPKLRRKHLAPQYLNFLHFCGNFGPPGFGSGSVFPMRIRIPNADPDPVAKINADPYGSGSVSATQSLGVLNLQTRTFFQCRDTY
jgi:hypothetical protein